MSKFWKEAIQYRLSGGHANDHAALGLANLGPKVGIVVPSLSQALEADIKLTTPLLNHTSELQAIINACPNYSTLKLPIGNYRFTNLTVTKSITLDWSGASLVVNPTTQGLTTGNHC